MEMMALIVVKVLQRGGLGWGKRCKITIELNDKQMSLFLLFPFLGLLISTTT